MTPSMGPIVVYRCVHRCTCFTHAVGALHLLGRTGPLLVRVGVAIVVGVVAAVLAGHYGRWPYAPVTGWIVAATIYLAWTWGLVHAMNAQQTKEHVCRQHEEDGTAGSAHAVMLLASVGSLGGVGYLLV